MTTQYPMLTYRGDITGATEAQPGALCGWDEVMRPYEVIEADFFQGYFGTAFDKHGCNACGRVTAHTHVYMQYALPKTIKRELESYKQRLTERGYQLPS